MKRLQQAGQRGTNDEADTGLSSRSLSYDRKEEKQVNQVFQRL